MRCCCAIARFATYRGSATVETGGLLTVLALLLAAAVPGFAGVGDSALATNVSSTLERLVRGDAVVATHTARVEHRAGSDAALPLRIDTSSASGDPARDWSRQWAMQAWSGTAHHAGSWWSADGSAAVCVVCGDASLGGIATPGLEDGRLHVAATGHGGVAIHAAQAQATTRVAVHQGDARATWNGTAGAQVGAEATGHADLAASHDGISIDGEATVRAGASARAEHDASVSLAGLAIRHVAGAEGWAGAGASAGGTLTVSSGTLTMGGRLGGALGFGGAADSRIEITFDQAAAQRAVVDLARQAMPRRSTSTGD